MAGIQKLLFIDTNIWLDFYRTQNSTYLGLLDRIETISERVIVTHQLETEFKKNRQAVIFATQKLLHDHIPRKVPSVGVLAEAREFGMVNKAIADATRRIKALELKLLRMVEKPTQHDPVFKAVHRIFHRDDDLVLTREAKDDEKRRSVRDRAERRFLHGCPPRKQNDTSFGDAINWEWMIDCALAKNAELVIVSRDADYGATHERKSYINDHLWHEFSNRVSKKRKLLLYSKVSDALIHFHVSVTPAQVEAERELIEDEPSSVASPDEFDDVSN